MIINLKFLKPTDLKSSRKKRGSVSCGHGRVGKHRKHPGGRGNAGGQHHHRILFDKYHPNHFSKKGMRSFHHTKQKNYCPSANIEKILIYVQQFNLNFSDVIDITRWGYFKLLGKGKLPNIPLIFKAKIFSKKATTKILRHGGTCILVP